MARHWIRVQVKPGEWKAFCAAVKAHNDDAPRVGLPEYRVWSQWSGPLGEAFIEGEYATVDEMHTRTLAAGKDVEHAAIDEAWMSHVVPGTGADWDLELVDLG